MSEKKQKIAVIHDAFLYRWGGERLVTLMAKSLNADLISGFFSKGSFVPEELGFSGEKFSLGKPVFTKWIRHLVLQRRFKNTKKILEKYDIIILSGNCLDILPNIAKNTKILYYCHTPPRYLFDFRERYLLKIPRIFRKIAEKILDFQAKKYIKLLEKIDIIFTNSENTHRRLLQFCQKKSIILYPPIDTKIFVPKNENSENFFVKNLEETLFEQTKKREYFLSFSRLSPPKRVEIVIDAFLQNPDKNLIFTYGDNDPCKNELLKKCDNAKNIIPIPAPSDADFVALLQNAMANVYIPIDEDFGMSPVEAMACGIPTIGANEWGLKETIIDGKTGVLIDILHHDDGVKKITEILTRTNADDWKKMALECRNRAENFSLERFVQNLKTYL